MADIARLEEVMGFIEAHPELHNQQLWMHRNSLAPSPRQGNEGPVHRAIMMKRTYPELTETECRSQGCLAGWAIHFWGDDENNTRLRGAWHEDAASVLGLTRDEADILFCSKNSREDMHQMVKDLANGLCLEDTWHEIVTHEIDEDGDRIRKYFYRRVENA